MVNEPRDDWLSHISKPLAISACCSFNSTTGPTAPAKFLRTVLPHASIPSTKHNAQYSTSAVQMQQLQAPAVETQNCKAQWCIFTLLSNETCCYIKVPQYFTLGQTLLIPGTGSQTIRCWCILIQRTAPFETEENIKHIKGMSNC